MDAGSLHGRAVLVTGADGLIGSHLSRALLEQGADVVVVRRDRPPVSGLELQGIDGRVHTVAGDICDEGLIARTLAEYEIADVFHLAAQTQVGVAARAPRSTFETNIRGTWVVLEACRVQGVESVIVASSDKAYGRHERLPYTEDAALAPIYPYDVSKAAADLIARSYWHTFGLPVAVTRLANVYGGGDLNRARLIPEAIGAALHGRAPVLRSDGSPERDFLYVDDAVGRLPGDPGRARLRPARRGRRGVQRGLGRRAPDRRRGDADLPPGRVGARPRRSAATACRRRRSTASGWTAPSSTG